MQVNILEECLEEFGMSLTELADHTGIKRSTMDGWRVRGKISPLGKITLELLLQNKNLKEHRDAKKSGYKFCPCCGKEVEKN